MFLIIIKQMLILVAVIALFLTISFLNQKTKPKKPVDLPENCQFCPSKTCIIKVADIEKKKEELEVYLNECEEVDEFKKD